MEQQHAHPYQQYAERQAGVSPQATPGAPPMPLYGLGQFHPVLGVMEAMAPDARALGGVVWDRVKQPQVMFFLGAASVGCAWIYFSLYRPLQEAKKGTAK